MSEQDVRGVLELAWLGVILFALCRTLVRR